MFLIDAAGDELLDLRVLGFDGRNAAVEQLDLPEAARAGALHPNDEFGRAALLVRGISHDRGHDGPDKTEADDDDDFLAGLALFGGKLLQADEFGLVFLRRRQWELFAGGTDGDLVLLHS